MTLRIASADVVYNRLLALVLAESENAIIEVRIDCAVDPLKQPQDQAYDIALAHLDPA